VLSCAGYLLGEYYIQFWKALDGWDIIILAAAVIGLIIYLLWQKKNSQKSG
jgi:membrane protein DedA with SNARE-associated domain